MSEIHHHPEIHGVRFGDVVVTVDRGLGDCVLRVPVPGPVGRVERTLRFHGSEEIDGAVAVQAVRADRNAIARNMLAALKFAGARLSGKDGGS